MSEFWNWGLTLEFCGWNCRIMLDFLELEPESGPEPGLTSEFHGQSSGIISGQETCRDRTLKSDTLGHYKVSFIWRVHPVM